MTNSTVTTSVAARTPAPPSTICVAIAVPTAAAPVLVRLLPSRIDDSSRRGDSSSRSTRRAPGTPAPSRSATCTRSNDRNAVSALEKNADRNSSATKIRK